MPLKVLLPLDALDADHPALVSARQSLPDAAFVLVHVAPPASPQAALAEAQLARLRAQVGSRHQVVVLQSPSVGGALIEYLTQHSQDLVWMGATRKGQLERFLLGSAAERMQRDSPVPVVTVPMAAAPPPTSVAGAPLRILHLHDFSEASEAARVFLQTHFPAAQVDLVHVIQPSALVAPVRTSVMPGGRASSLTLLRRRNREWRLEAKRRMALLGGGRVCEGEPAQVALTLVRGGQYDLLAVGKSTKGWLDRQFLGSTSQQLLRQSPVPVLTAGPHEAHPGGRPPT
ncbi:universal stress protein [Deinococcus ficus]|uniref:universal stress protein n=1 Tax=Deinococcus ficus TaxID=317577 RepID=UPI0003B639FA|nr:universal stress protein [Deinococcus ficus]